MGAVLVAVYCFAGGIRASIWTDAAQSMVMIVAMSVFALGGDRFHGRRVGRGHQDAGD